MRNRHRSLAHSYDVVKMGLRRTSLIAALSFAALPSLRAQSFNEFLSEVGRAPDTSSATRLVNEFMSRHNAPVVEKNLIHFLYRGNARFAAAPGEINGWNPVAALMTRVKRTDLFYRTESLAVDGRVEYKIMVDSAWMLDPLNQRTTMGGYGANSEVWMPGYRTTPFLERKSTVPRGSFDTLWIESTFLEHKHPVFFYRPAGSTAGEPLPVLLVTDGSDYLRLGSLDILLDNLIAEKQISPVAAVFVEPRIELGIDSTNHRMREYAASDAYLDFLEKEVLPAVAKRFAVLPEPGRRVILGASMGGLIATYATLTRPSVFPNCAAQSPAYLQAKGAVIARADSIAADKKAKFYIQTGTVNDTRTEAQLVSKKLRLSGGNVRYEEFTEGHNWTNWKTHLPKMLKYFFPR